MPVCQFQHQRNEQSYYNRLYYDVKKPGLIGTALSTTHKEDKRGEIKGLKVIFQSDRDVRKAF
jgi:hypothetical protein